MNPSDDINRIIVGLGGQGSRVVNEVRKAVLKNGELPPGLDFVAIDSDRVALGKLDSVPEAHRIHLAAPDDNITETVVPWLPHEFRPKAGGGCGMQRLTGKAMYLVHRHRILDTIRDVARKLRQRTQVSDFMVVIVNAAGGGTGSGMAIDFTIDLRGDLKEITGQDPLMFGIGILPSRSETIQRANGVALVKELHFLLSNKEPVVIGGRDYSNPFELYFLVGREVMGIERDEDLLNSIVRFTIDLGLIPTTNRDDGITGKGAGWVDLQDIRTLVKGAGHMFSTFGYYRAAFPAETLLEYYDALDKLGALRKEVPTIVTDVESQRQALEDRKIAVAHAEEILRQAQARVTRLRSDGILGANRPDLAKLLSDIARAEDAMRKLKREIAELEGDLPSRAEKREALEAQLREWEARAETLRASIVAPLQSRTSYSVPISDAEIEILSEKRHLLKEGSFRAVMEALERLPDYHDKTMEVIGKSKILHLPLLNYRMAFHTAAAFPPRVLGLLRKHGFVRFDAAGNPVVSDDHLWMVMAMLSSNPENIDASKVSGRAFKEIVEGHIARRAEVKIVPSRTKPFEVVIHSWMVGLPVSPVAPGYPPRLRELEWLMPEYEQVAREGGLAQHHAFLFGDPLALGQLASVVVDRTSPARTNELAAQFWGSYAPIDSNARWLQLPPTVAEALVSVEDLLHAGTTLEDAIDEFRTGDASLASVERLTAALTHGTETIEGFGRAYTEAAHPLRDRIATLAAQLERAREAPRDGSKLLAMDELTGETLAAVASATTLIRQLHADLPEAIGLTLASARDSGHEQGVRWQHMVAQAEARAGRLYETTTETLKHLGDLERALERVQQTIRSRALAPISSDAHHAAKLPRPSVNSPMMGMIASGNGHHDMEELE